jgi:hypothetical protein
LYDQFYDHSQKSGCYFRADDSTTFCMRYELFTLCCLNMNLFLLCWISPRVNSMAADFFRWMSSPNKSRRRKHDYMFYSRVYAFDFWGAETWWILSEITIFNRQRHHISCSIIVVRNLSTICVVSSCLRLERRKHDNWPISRVFVSPP